MREAGPFCPVRSLLCVSRASRRLCFASVIRFTSSAGISIFRRHLHEIPELGITVDSVLAANDPAAAARIEAQAKARESTPQPHHTHHDMRLGNYLFPNTSR